MSRLILIIVIVAFFFSFIYACDTEKPHNIYDPDPGNSYYKPPKLKIKSELKNGVATESNVSFEIERDESLVEYDGTEVNDEKLVYRYSLGDQNWSKWIKLSEQNKIELSCLDEGNYLFKLQSNYSGRDEKYASSPESLSFEVNAVEGPALMLDKRCVKLSQGQDFDLQVMAEEIEEQRRMVMAHIVLNYDPEAIEIMQITEQKDFLKKNSGETIFISPELSEKLPKSGEIELNIGIGGGNPIGVDGSGPMARLTFRALRKGNTELKIDNTSKIRDENNSDIILKEIVNSEIEIY